MEGDLKLDIVKEIDESVSSKDDESRKELLWERREEILLSKWSKSMINSSKEHYIKGKRTKKINNTLNVVTILISLSSSIFKTELDKIPLLSHSIMYMTSALIGITSFFNLSKRQEQHFQYEQKYKELSNEIDKEMAKPKRHRIACDVYLQKIMSEMNKLDSSAPLI